jgi:L-amino acid N-acyltransferase YncA
MIIREVCPDDAEEIVSILNPIIESGAYTVLDSPVTVDFEREFIRNFPERGLFYAAIDEPGERIVGFQNIEPFAAYTNAFYHVGIIATYVNPSYRRQGVGQRLAEVVFENAGARGYEKLFTYVRADNAGALAFYSKLGFHIVGTAKKQARIGKRYVDEIIIEKFL